MAKVYGMIKKYTMETIEKEDIVEKSKKWQAMYLYFVIYSVIGWLYEVFLEVVVYRWGFSNRGFLFGPYLPVYGIGAIVILLCLQPLQKKKISLGGRWNMTPFLVFLGIVFLTTAIELVTSYILEWQTGGWLWDYTRFSYNFEGRIALNPSIRFGIGGMFFLYLIQPFLEKMNTKLSDHMRVWLCGIFFVIMTVDYLLKMFVFSA